MKKTVATQLPTTFYTVDRSGERRIVGTIADGGKFCLACHSPVDGKLAICKVCASPASPVTKFTWQCDPQLVLNVPEVIFGKQRRRIETERHTAVTKDELINAINSSPIHEFKPEVKYGNKDVKLTRSRPRKR